MFGKCTNAHYFLFMDLADLSPPTIKVCFSEFRCFVECFFVLRSWLLENPVPTTTVITNSAAVSRPNLEGAIPSY